MRKLITYFFCFIVVLLCGYVGFRSYKVWKQKHALEMARAFLASSDERNAVLSLQQVLQANPANLEANRLMARLTEAARSPAALIWWSRVVALNPQSTFDRLALAQADMIFGNYSAATNALNGVDAAGKQTAAYHNLAGAVAAAANDLAGAESHFLEAARLDPLSEVPQVNLDLVHLHGSNALAQAQARANLERIATDPNLPGLHCQALRQLTTDALQNKQNQAAEAYSRELVGQTNSQFADRLLRLDVLAGTGSSEFKPALAELQREAAKDRAKVYELATWQLAHNAPADTLVWLQTLPKETLTSQAAMLPAAECRTTLGDWPGLQTSLQKQNWAELDFLRHAFLARALKGQGLTTAATGEWEQALMAANGQKQSLVMLFNLAAQWNFSSEAQSLLWTIVNQYPEERWAYQALSKALIAGGQTRPLMMLFSRQSKRAPSDLAAKRNVAMLALLLDAREFKPFELAQEVYRAAPTNSSVVSTYAFSLYLQRKNSEALAAIEKLSAEQLENPVISGYYGLILKANGDAARAKSYLELSSKATLLPEERKLIDAAKTGA